MAIGSEQQRDEFGELAEALDALALQIADVERRLVADLAQTSDALAELQATFADLAWFLGIEAAPSGAGSAAGSARALRPWMAWRHGRSRAVARLSASYPS